jgi:YbbR domain-containing protein
MRFDLRRNLSLKIFSLLLAIVCWYVIRSEEVRVKDFSVPLEYVSLSPSLDLAGEVVDTVEVRLRATEPLLRTITADSLSARIDLSRAPLGEQYVQITPEMIRAPGGAEVASIDPDRIRLRIEKRVKREVPIVAEFSGQTPRGYQKAKHVIDPATAQIEGPESEVFRVTRATAGTILLNGETGDYEVQVSPIPDSPPGSHVRIVWPQGPVRVLVSIQPVDPTGPKGGAEGPGQRARPRPQ